MKRLVHAWSWWVALLSRREDATPLALSRIVAGASVAFHLALMGVTGTAAGVWVDVRYGGMRSLDPGPVFRHLGGASPANMHLLLGLGIVAGVFMAVGLFTRPATVLTWFCWRTLTGFNDLSGGSSDDLLVNILFLLMFSGCGAALSLDATLRGKKRDEVPSWPRYLLIFQIAVMYLMTGLQKISIGWVPGGPADALWYILQQPTWHRFDMRWLAPFYPLTQLATVVTWCFEVGGPILLLAFWYRDTADRPGRVRRFFNRFDVRSWYLALGLLLHLGIWALMEVGPFLNGVLAIYAVCFTGAEWKAGWARARGWLASRAKSGRPANPAAPVSNP